MKTLVTFRLDAELLESARRMARAENRTLTNFVETVLKRSFEADKAISTAGAEQDVRQS